MTNEEAIELNKNLMEYMRIQDRESDSKFLTENYIALEMGIKALEQEPILDKIRAEIKEWYWQADKQALAKDPCVVDSMIDMFIRTINKYKAESEDKG